MLKVAVLVVGKDTVATVTTGRKKRLYDLKLAIKEQLPSVVTCEPRDVSLYLAKKNGAWLNVVDPDASRLLEDEAISDELRRITKNQQPLSSALCLNSATFEVVPPVEADDVIQILAILPHLHAQLRPPPMTIREKRWTTINEFLDHRSNDKLQPGEISTSFISVVSALQPLSAVFAREALPEEEVDAMYASVCRTNKSLKLFPDGSAAAYKFFATQLLVHVCSLVTFVECRMNARVTGRRVHADVVFDFVMRRGDLFIGVVFAPDDVSNSSEECVLGCEAIADVYRLNQVFGIVVDGRSWCFFRNRHEYIETQTEEMTVTADGAPTRDGVHRIAELIYALLK